jgi:hypothetical protein
VLGLSKLQSLVQVGLELLLEGVHLVLLLLNELGLGSNDLLLSFLHVLLSFLNLKFGCLLLNLMGFGISKFKTNKVENYQLLTSFVWQDWPGFSASLRALG